MSRNDERARGEATNGATIDAEIAWFVRLLDLRFRIHGGELPDDDILAREPAPPLADDGPPYSEALRSAGLDSAERLVLILAILPHLRPQALDSFLIPNSQSARPFTEFGGVSGAQSGFRPTRETALFLLAGESMELRLRYMPMFAPGARLHAGRILEYPSEPGEPGPWTALIVSPAWIDRLIVGAKSAPRFGPDFPAQRLATSYQWGDLVLADEVRDELEDLVVWVENERLLMEDWGLARHLKPGYRALFHGPPGTGKTVTAAVIGKRLDLPVYRVDLSRVVSKYIGETEKNLAALFDHAADGDMILFFDEADALFGKRGETRTANDRHANQQIAYLLQRIEDCPGVVILASNLKANIDQAFARRFQAMILFAMPDAEARRELWRLCFGAENGPGFILDEEVDLARLARDHEISGGSIVNVLRYVGIQAAKSGTGKVGLRDLTEGLRREIRKEGRISAG
jgi:hypothetical protein